jgi:hypothetical protein
MAMQSYGPSSFGQMCRRAQGSFVSREAGWPSRSVRLWHPLGLLWSTCSTKAKQSLTIYNQHHFSCISHPLQCVEGCGTASLTVECHQRRRRRRDHQQVQLLCRYVQRRAGLCRSGSASHWLTAELYVALEDWLLSQYLQQAFARPETRWCPDCRRFHAWHPPTECSLRQDGLTALQLRANPGLV